MPPRSTANQRPCVRLRSMTSAAYQPAVAARNRPGSSTSVDAGRARRGIDRPQRVEVERGAAGVVDAEAAADVDRAADRCRCGRPCARTSRARRAMKAACAAASRLLETACRWKPTRSMPGRRAGERDRVGELRPRRCRTGSARRSSRWLPVERCAAGPVDPQRDAAPRRRRRRSAARRRSLVRALHVDRHVDAGADRGDRGGQLGVGLGRAAEGDPPRRPPRRPRAPGASSPPEATSQPVEPRRASVANDGRVPVRLHRVEHDGAGRQRGPERGRGRPERRRCRRRRRRPAAATGRSAAATARRDRLGSDVMQRVRGPARRRRRRPRQPHPDQRLVRHRRGE